MASADQVVNNAGTVLEIATVTYGDRTIPAQLFTVTGVTASSPRFESSVLDDSSYGDGLTPRSKKSSVQAEYSIEGIYIPGTTQEGILFPLAGNSEDARDEAYVKLTYGNGDSDSFFCIIINYLETVALRTVKRFSFTAVANDEVTRVIDPNQGGGGGEEDTTPPTVTVSDSQGDTTPPSITVSSDQGS